LRSPPGRQRCDQFDLSLGERLQLAEPDKRKRRQRTRHDPSGFAEAELADQFVKLLGLLSSDHAGERANAVAAVEPLRQRYGISWRDIIREGITVPD